MTTHQSIKQTGADQAIQDHAGRSTWAEVTGAAVLLTLLATVLLIAFAWPASRSSVHDIPLAVAGPAPAVQQVSTTLEERRPGAFDVEALPDQAAALAAIRDREIYGAIVIGDGGPTVLTASAASPAVAQALTLLAVNLQAGDAQQAVPVQDVVATPADDPRGAGLAAGALPLVLAGLAAAGLTTARLRGSSRRLTAVAGFALLGGVALAAVLDPWLGILDGSFWAEAGVIALGIAAVSVPLLGLEWLLGTVGLALGGAVMMLLGNPLSGLSSAPEMLPTGWGALGQLLPPGASGALLRSISFFDGASAARPAIVLTAWVAAGLAVCIAAGRRRKRAPVA